MTSIYQLALGNDFYKLHPQIQRRFGFCSQDHMACVGQGVMHRIWNGGTHTLPFLQLGTARHIMFPEQGHDITFTIQNHAYVDQFGRETVTWLRTFYLPNHTQRHFDAYMIYSPQRACIVDYLGTHQHLAVDIHLSVDERGGLRIRSGQQRVYEHCLGFTFPPALSGIAEVCEWFDDATQHFCIEVSVQNPYFGKLFGYSGYFKANWYPVDHAVANAFIRPTREEVRE
ncbi:MAG: DUF4166 domain-containing protein [Anaerolineae bacterium]|nr:DUF4166 domain-containing protein [Anaerolineae bacterium]